MHQGSYSVRQPRDRIVTQVKELKAPATYAAVEINAGTILSFISYVVNTTHVNQCKQASETEELNESKLT